MPLKDYTGPANSPEIFQHLVGERIVACFLAEEGRVWVVTESGDALSVGSSQVPTVYWRVPKSKVDAFVGQRRAEIERKIRELAALPGISIPELEAMPIPKLEAMPRAKSWADHVLDNNNNNDDDDESAV